ncbi:MAG: hypothetical protein IPG04_24770 [Polyangiaceae bacterium]|nr:hypothetical protein [Polyangiaceae bacterium]
MSWADPLDLSESVKLARLASGPGVPAALAALPACFSAGPARDRLTAYRGLEAFLDARVRGLGASREDQEEVVARVLEKLVARTALFLAADNPAAYLTTTIKHCYLSLLRRRRREEARDRRCAVEPPEKPEDDPLARLAEARAIDDLHRIAADVLEASRPDDLRAQREEAWHELWGLYRGDVTMDAILASHTARDPALLAECAVDAASAQKRARDRVLQRHHRLRKLLDATIVRRVEDPEASAWTLERGRDARGALRKLLVRCQRAPRASAEADR